jgi:predicted RNase H-like HicB family nuclease
MNYVLTDYIEAIMKKAKYEIIKDEEPYYGEIPSIKGIWATGKTLEECRKNLKEALEDYIIISLEKHLSLPEIDGIRITITKVNV